jgi:hypothetical protein
MRSAFKEKDMDKVIKINVASTIALLLMGCTAAPTVEYGIIRNSSDLKGDEFDSFSFQQSLVKVDAKKDDKGAPLSPLEIVSVSVPIEFPDFKIALRRADSFGVRTNLNITKFDNTDLIKEVGTEVVDNRVDLIGKIGGILAKVVAFSGDVKAADLPVVINTYKVLLGNKIEGGAIRDVPSGQSGITLDFDALPKDAKPMSDFPVGKKASALYYSACRNITVKVKLSTGVYSQSLRISDPRYFQVAGLPIKGKIVMHSQCGASVTSEKDTGVKSSADVVDALLVQAKAIKDALEAAKKDGK